MKCLILGAGGVGCYFGARLLNAGHEVLFVARGKHLDAIQECGLKVAHPDMFFDQKVDAVDIDALKEFNSSSFDVIFLATKSTATHEIALFLKEWIADKTNNPYIVSLQNGVENEDILCQHLGVDKIIGGLTRKIGAHVIAHGEVEAVGRAETLLGLMRDSKEGVSFLEDLTHILNHASIPTEVFVDIRKELWKKLVINNGVNALCALLEVKTGIVMHHPKLSSIVKGLMQETALAAKALHVKISQEEVDAMFALILGFDSIKPSMLVDVEHQRSLEIEQICGVVVRNLHIQGLDAPYTKSISALLEFKLEQ